MLNNINIGEVPAELTAGNHIGTIQSQRLDEGDRVVVYLTVTGWTGGVFALCLQTSPNGADWFDWYRTSDIAAGAAAATSKLVPGVFPAAGSITTVGKSTATVATPVLTKGTMAPGPLSKFLRAVYEIGADVTAAVAPSIIVEVSKPTG